MGFKSGFISIVGRPNVGKSTFLNYILEEKISIMSPKAQTTRNNIRGIYTDEESQIVFVDTPGIHKPKHKLGDYMVSIALGTLSESDAIIFMTNVDDEMGPGDKLIIEKLKQLNNKKIFLVLNKTDLCSKEQIIRQIAKFSEMLDFEEIIPTSSLDGDNVLTVINEVKKHLPEGPKYYPDEEKTDNPFRFILSELIREKVLYKTEEEVPHSVAVIIEDLQENKKLLKIQALIIVERDSQKGILIGKNGSMIKSIGSDARVEMENIFGKKVYLELFVKVQKDWRNKKMDISNFGYDQRNY